MDFAAPFIRGSVTPIVLSILRDGPSYAYDMVRIVAKRSGGKLDWKEGSLYPALHQLEKTQLIAGQWKLVAGPRGGMRRRRYYTLTRAGRAELRRRLREWREFSSAVDALLDAK